jgi:hypothetical protein
VPESISVNSLLFRCFNNFLVKENHVTVSGHVPLLSKVKGIPLTVSGLKNKVPNGQVTEQEPYLCALASMIVDFSFDKKALGMFKDVESICGTDFSDVFKG